MTSPRIGEEAEARVARYFRERGYIFETLSPAAVPLPRDVFDGPRDRRWVPNADRTALIPLSGAVER